MHAKLRRAAALMTIAILLLLLEAPAGLAAPEDGISLQVPLASFLEQLSSRKSVELLTLAEGEYTLALNKLDNNGIRWVRVVAAREDYFYGACVLGSWEQLSGLETLEIGATLERSKAAFTFTTLPDQVRRAALELPLDMAGAAALSAFAAEQGVVLHERAAPAKETTTTAPAAPPPARLPVKVGPGPYLLALALLLTLLALLVAGQVFGRRWLKVMWLRARNTLEIMRLNQRREPIALLAEPPPALTVTEQETREFAPVGHAAAHVAPDEECLRIIAPTQEIFSAAPQEQPAVQSYFLGKTDARAIQEYRFLTVGLCNYEALQQIQAETVRPLFAPHPQGHTFSLEEESGNLYLHLRYFAPPSFVMQSILRGVFLERIFDVTDTNGNFLALDSIFNRSIVGIVPAKTTRTEAGFLLAEKGRLVIGKT